MSKKILISVVSKLARPLVVLSLRHGIKLGELIDGIKREYVTCAEEFLNDNAESISTSRISLMTGVHRTDVAAIRAEESFKPRERHTASDVISQWRYDPRFCLGPGKPKPLEIEGKESEFAQLVKSVSLSVSPYTVSFELERLGLIKRLSDGRVKLLSRVFVPKGDPEATLKMLAEDAEDLFICVEENAFRPEETACETNHHLKTEYNNIPTEALPEIRKWLMREGSALHEKARNFLSRFDRDLTPRVSGSGRNRVAIASFSRVEDLKESVTETNIQNQQKESKPKKERR